MRLISPMIAFSFEEHYVHRIRMPTMMYITYAHGMRNEMHKIKKQGSSKQKRDLIIGKVKPHIKGDLFVYHSKYVH